MFFKKNFILLHYLRIDVLKIYIYFFLLLLFYFLQADSEKYRFYNGCRPVEFCNPWSIKYRVAKYNVGRMWFKFY